MALADINVKKPREAQIWNCSTELWFIGFYRTAIFLFCQIAAVGGVFPLLCFDMGRVENRL